MVAGLGACLTWGIAVLAFVLVFLATLFICLRIIWTASAGKARAAFLTGALGWDDGGILLGLAGNPLTLPQLVPALVEDFHRMGLDDGRFLLFFLNGLAIAVALLLAFAASATLVDTWSRESGAARLKEQTRMLRHFLYAGATVLIAGSAQAAAMHRLPVAYLQERSSGALESAAQLAAVATGALWSLFLVAIYLPAALVLRARFTAEAERALPGGGEKERETWLADAAWTSRLPSSSSVLAVLGPVLTSLPLAGLFELLGGLTPPRPPAYLPPSQAQALHPRLVARLPRECCRAKQVPIYSAWYRIAVLHRTNRGHQSIGRPWTAPGRPSGGKPAELVRLLGLKRECN